LNGHTLALAAGDALPSLRGDAQAAGRATLAPATITFFAVAGAANPACH
jgi:heparanase